MTSTLGRMKIVIDLWMGDNPLCAIRLGSITAANMALVTYDHFDPMADEVHTAKETGAILVAEAETVSRFNRDVGLAYEKVIFGIRMNVGASATIDGITITMTRAFHSSGTGLAAGYMVELEDGTVIYHAGDTGIFERVGCLGNCMASIWPYSP